MRFEVDVIALPATRDLVSRLPSDRWAAVTSGSRLLMRALLSAAHVVVPDLAACILEVTAEGLIISTTG